MSPRSFVKNFKFKVFFFFLKGKLLIWRCMLLKIHKTALKLSQTLSKKIKHFKLLRDYFFQKGNQSFVVYFSFWIMLLILAIN